MPRYYFDTCENGNFTRDETGLELDGLQTAKDEAARGLADLAQDVLQDSLNHEMSIEVRDEEKRLLFTTSLVFAVENPPQGIS